MLLSISRDPRIRQHTVINTATISALTASCNSFIRRLIVGVAFSPSKVACLLRSCRVAFVMVCSFVVDRPVIVA